MWRDHAYGGDGSKVVTRGVALHFDARRSAPFGSSRCLFGRPRVNRRAACGGRRLTLPLGRLSGPIKLSRCPSPEDFRPGATSTRTVPALADDSSFDGCGRALRAGPVRPRRRDGFALDAIEADLKSLKAMRADSRDLRDVLASPRFSAEDKAKSLAAIGTRAGFDATTGKFLGLLAANGRTGALADIIGSFERLSAKRRGVVSAQVTNRRRPDRRPGPRASSPPCARRWARIRRSRPGSTPPSWAGSRCASAPVCTMLR